MVPSSNGFSPDTDSIITEKNETTKEKQCSNKIIIKVSFDKTKYTFDQSIWECNGHFDHRLSNTKAFFVCHLEFAQRETLSFRFI